MQAIQRFSISARNASRSKSPAARRPLTPGGRDESDTRSSGGWAGAGGVSEDEDEGGWRDSRESKESKGSESVKSVDYARGGLRGEHPGENANVKVTGPDGEGGSGEQLREAWEAKKLKREDENEVQKVGKPIMEDEVVGKTPTQATFKASDIGVSGDHEDGVEEEEEEEEGSEDERRMPGSFDFGSEDERPARRKKAGKKSGLQHEHKSSHDGRGGGVSGEADGVLGGLFRKMHLR